MEKPHATEGGRGVRHTALDGARGAEVRFRPDRIDARQINGELVCRFRVDPEATAECRVANVSEFGVGLVAPEMELRHGTRLTDLVLLFDGTEFWRGAGVVAHHAVGTVGVRFTSGLLQVDQLRRGAPKHPDRLGAAELAAAVRQTADLPLPWRARVGDLAALLHALAGHLDALDQDQLTVDEELQLFDGLWESWGGEYVALLTELYASTRDLPEEAIGLARSYASALLLPLLARCDMHRRAWEKPRGYAGDYVLIEQYFDPVPQGATLFSRFLSSAGTRYTLSRAVIGREALLRAALREVASAPGAERVTVASIGSGPALELRRFAMQAEPPLRPMRALLVDQDREALEHCHREINRVFIERFDGQRPFEVEHLQIALRQILRAEPTPESAAIAREIQGAALIYAGGLFDYLPDHVAKRLLQRLYSALGPGGRLYIGNLDEAEDSVWLLDMVLAWHLVYRDEATLRRLVADLNPTPARVAIDRDSTGTCLMLDVRRP